MRMPLPSISVGAAALTALSSLALSQAVAPPLPAAPTAAQAPLYDPQQFPAIRGEIERLTLTARGDIDGLILKDGTEVKTSPELSTQIAFVLKPGDRVTIHGLRAAALPLVRAVSITNEVTHRTVTDAEGSTAFNPPRPRGAPSALAASSEVSGRVRMALHGPQGEVNGVLLESGTILRFAPDSAGQFATVIQPHQSVVADGMTVTTSLGTVVDVQELGPSRERLVAVAPPMPPPDARGPAEPRRRPPPPPGGPLATPPPPPEGPASTPGAVPLSAPPVG